MPDIKSIWLGLAFCACCALCRAELAKIPAKTDSLAKPHYVLPTVRVIADRPQESVGTVQLVDFPDQQGVAALNLYDGLQNISGVTNTSGTKDESNLRIRGFRKNEVKILVDGRPLNSGYFGNVDLHQLAPADIREIRILKGPGSAVYGSGTMGGVVNIITRDPDSDSWLKLSALAKRNNTNRLAITSSHRLGDFGYWIYAAREHNEGLVISRAFPGAPFENGGVRDHSRKTQYDLQTRLDYGLSPFEQLGFSAGMSYVPEKLLPSSVYAMDYRLYKDYARSWGTLEYENVLNEFAKLSGHLYYDGGADTYRQYNDPDHEHLTTDSRMKYSTLGLNPRLEWSPDSRNTLNLGFRAESLRSTRKDNGSYLAWTPHWLNLYNVFGQWEYKFSELLSATASVAAASHHSDMKNALSLYLEPTGGIFANWNENSQTSLSVGKNTSFPTMRQLFSADRGNPDLKPQHALKAELSQRQGVKLGKTLLSNEFSVFYNDMRDLIDVYGERYENIYRVRSWGAEYSLLAAPWPWWETQIGYSCLFWRSGSDYRLTETPRNQFNLLQTWKLPARFSINYSCSYSDIRYSQDSSDNYRVLHSYWLHNVSLSKKLGKHSIAAGLENLFDSYYEMEYGYPGAGLNFFVRLEAVI